MAEIYTAHMATGREDWLEFRTKGIGGSDAAAAIGVSRYRSPLDLWCEKTGRVEPKDISEEPAVKWGLILEAPIAVYFAVHHPELTVLNWPATLVSNDHPFMVANLDRVIDDEEGNRGILEIKTTGQYMVSDWDEGVPLEYYTQVSHYLAVTGYSFVWVAVLIGGRDYREYRLERDDEDIARLIELEEAFWQMVIDDVMPEVTGADDEGHALSTLYSPDNGEIISIEGELERAIYDYIEATDALKRAQGEKDFAASRIKAQLAQNKGAENMTLKVMWYRLQETRFDKDRFEADHPEIYSQYLTVKPKDGGIRIKEK